MSTNVKSNLGMYSSAKEFQLYETVDYWDIIFRIKNIFWSNF